MTVSIDDIPVNSPHPDTSGTIIDAESKRQVMDWSLVLASQDIPTRIVRLENGWALEVEPQDHPSAVAAIRQYRLENRGWEWRQQIPWVEETFHWGSLGWCLLLILVHWITTQFDPTLRQAGQLSGAALKGEWWRVFTAMLLHADLGHLMSNATVGFLLLGLAMARYGAGLGLLCAYLAGAAGNVGGLLLYPHAYFGLGASGMVMGALGLISIPPFLHRGWFQHGRRHLLRIVLAGVFLFLLLGVNPASDVVAHVGGFLAGACAGVLLNLVPRAISGKKLLAVSSWLFLAVFNGWPIWLALNWKGR